MKAFGLLLLVLTGCKTDEPQIIEPGPDPYDVQVGPYDATVRMTEYGVPHIQGEDYGSLGFGLGSVYARDHLCVLADQLLKTQSQRSKYFGPGTADANLDSDFAWLQLGINASAEEVWFDIRPDLQEMLIGYTAGYNQFLADTPASERPEPCRNAEWVQPITHIDLVAYHLHLGLLGSGYALTDFIATAAPPAAPQSPRRSAPDLSELDRFNNLELGSNGWAIGADLSSTDGGMLLSNTHFPSQGERQWYEFHMTGPNGLDVYGASLVGVPMVNIGFNQNIAWTHTVSNNPRFTFYAHELNPDNPTEYLSGGEFVPMEQNTFTIDVLQGDGSTGQESRTMYRTEYGPMLNAPVIGWTRILGFSYRDANINNIELYDSWFEMNHATTMDEFKSAQRDHMGIPWVHTLAADDQGNAFYTDSANTPNVADSTEQAWLDYRVEQPLAELFWQQAGLYVFEADNDTFRWIDDPDSPRSGIVPFDDAPQLDRRDFVTNANENHWMSNPSAPLTGYSWMYGETGTPRTPRTKMNNRFFMESGAASAAGEDGEFTLDELQDAALSARSSVAEDLRDEVVARCTGVTDYTVTVDSVESTIDLSPWCNALGTWDMRHAVDSEGAHVMREWLSAGVYTWTDIRNTGPLYGGEFDANNPIYTPNGLTAAPSEGLDPVLTSLATAAVRLTEAGISPTDALGDIQFRRIGSNDIPTQGGMYQDGVISIADFSNGGDTTLFPDVQRGNVLNGTTDLTDEGYVVNSGNSWIMAMQFGEDGPEARAIMVYGQSEDARSPHFADQAEVYAEERLRPVLFDDADIAASPALVTEQYQLDEQ
ncbi:MAG: acyl-homoserine-lactone acylase [Myxococcota bacterium]|jgi:acyl-homoserine-lactone acylase